MAAKLFSILIFATCVALGATALRVQKTIPVPSGGSESSAFDSKGSLYTGVNDGRILKLTRRGWVDFAYASPLRTKKLCDGTTDKDLGNICGRALGIGFYYKTGELYIADAYHGLCVVGPKGGLARQLVANVAGKPLKWLDGLDVDQNNGNAYFTDVSTRFNLSQINEHLAAGDDNTGRAIEYNRKTKKSRELLTGLMGAGGAGCAKDSSFVFISEFAGSKITKYWLTGPKANTHELVSTVTHPANIKLNPSGDFWVSVNINNVTTAIRIDENAKILEKIPFPFYNGTFCQEAQLHNGYFFLTSILLPFTGIARFNEKH